MECNKDEITETQLRKAVHEAFGHLIKSFENEPGLILEGEAEPVDEGNTLEEIRSWLFGRRRTDGDTGNRADK
ncbi:hypothetical protein ACFLTV_01270 [Chloroflexota bacterium]